MVHGQNDRAIKIISFYSRQRRLQIVELDVRNSGELGFARSRINRRGNDSRILKHVGVKPQDSQKGGNFQSEIHGGLDHGRARNSYRVAAVLKSLRAKVCKKS